MLTKIMPSSFFLTLGNLWQFYFNLQYTKTGQEYVHLCRCHMVESDCSVISFLMLFVLSTIETSTVFSLRQVLHTLCLDHLKQKSGIDRDLDVLTLHTKLMTEMLFSSILLVSKVWFNLITTISVGVDGCGWAGGEVENNAKLTSV